MRNNGSGAVSLEDPALITNRELGGIGAIAVVVMATLMVAGGMSVLPSLVLAGITWLLLTRVVVKARLKRLARTYCASKGWEYIAVREFSEHDALLFRQAGHLGTWRLKFRVGNGILVPISEPTMCHGEQ